MSIELLVDFNEFWSRLRSDIQSAADSVCVQTFAFEGDCVGRRLAATLLASPAKDKRILADSFTHIVLSDRFRYSPANLFRPELRNEARRTTAMRRHLERAGIRVRFTNPCGPTPRRLLSRNHKKLILVDDQIAYIGGFNFSEHNASWHDMMLRFDDPKVVRFLSEDFRATWLGRDCVAQEDCDGTELLAADGRNNQAVFQRVLELIDAAVESIFVESPYITFPFYERLREAARRQVRVTLVTPEANNWRFFRNYARLESARSEIDLRLFQGRMTHLKAMLIDERYLIAGSTNFDYLSYRIHQELIAIMSAPEVISEFRERVIIPDLLKSRRFECQASAMGQRWLTWQTKLIDAAMTALT